ncbi:DEAD/DEAH box helicase family protein [Deinococcus sp. 14RED07]|uniref:DEAD/DEAH box helicase family protein n=1 Tax=Deinococcus sp. 14RED07 TaxID=2745874 RepID=UPI001E2C6C8E|nr:DEAD/DEAH box helicase family protein [Deinococcus sp. 14RED07]
MLTEANLKDFQLDAIKDLTEILTEYPSVRFPRWFRGNGKPYPLLCKLQAITGSGKTPILAVCAGNLDNAIILWTTNRGAVISQTASKLRSGGQYAALLPPDAKIFEMDKMSSLDWTEVVTARRGVTIILSTVAAFNQEDERLNIHKQRGDTSYWQQLAGQSDIGRNRELYIFYDEGHGLTKFQFRKLTELDPKALVLASASPLPEDLNDLLPGETIKEKEAALKRQTAFVPTFKVVKAGLLKTRLYLVDCNTTRQDAITEAHNKWVELAAKLQPLRQMPVMCCIVNSTLEGLEVWEILTQHLKVPPGRVAVHLANVNKAKDEANPGVPWGQLVDTYAQKRSPEELHDLGFTHLIWNLSLREGWDEPWAYVAYLDGLGKSSTDITQKIGRFLRQPRAQAFEDGDLNSAYFYFNLSDEDFSEILVETQRAFEHDGYEVISTKKDDTRAKSSRMAEVKETVELPIISETFGEDLNALDQILIDNIPLFDKAELTAPGKVSTRVLDMEKNQEDLSLKSDELRSENTETTVWDYLVLRLSNIDKRIAKKNQSTRFGPYIKNDRRLRQSIQYGSPAMQTINTNIQIIVKQLNDAFTLERDLDQTYTIKPFSLVAPDLQTDDPKKRERYKVRVYQNALHDEYNGLNPFEVSVATELDKLGGKWCRNPSRTGYSIPVPVIGSGTSSFFPDFLYWSPVKNTIWAIDPKGSFLATDAIRDKLLQVSLIENMPVKIKVALILEDRYEIGVAGRLQRMNTGGYTLVAQKPTGIKALPFASLNLLMKEFKK